jgi:hypothetical protein
MYSPKKARSERAATLDIYKKSPEKGLSNVPDLEVEHDVVVEHAVHRPSTRRSAQYCNCK